MSTTDHDILPLREDDPEPPKRRRRRGRLVFVFALSLLLIPVMLILGTGLWLNQRIDRLPDVFADIPEAERPLVVAPEGEIAAEPGATFLLAGTDRRSEVPTTGSQAEAEAWIPGLQRSDAIMMVHITADGERAYVASIPRDSYVTIPGYGNNKINAAFSFGGPSLMIRTVEGLTDVRIDHFAVVDWSGLVALVDAVGGIELTFAESQVGRDQTWSAGTHTLDGASTLNYVGERKALRNGDFDRVKRQQQVVAAIADKVFSKDVFTDPAKTLRVAKTFTTSMSVDDALSADRIVSLASKMTGLRPSNITYVTVPTSGTGSIGGQSIVVINEERGEEFWQAFENDTLEDWLATSP